MEQKRPTELSHEYARVAPLLEITEKDISMSGTTCLGLSLVFGKQLMISLMTCAEEGKRRK